MIYSCPSLCIVAVGMALAQTSAPTTTQSDVRESPSPRPVIVSVIQMSGTRVRGALLALDTTSGVRIRSDKSEQRVPMDQLDAMVLAQRSESEARGPWVVELRDGSRLAAAVEGNGEAGLIARHAMLGKIPVAWEEIRSIRRETELPPPIGGDASHDQDAQESSTGDVIALQNGDRVSGTIIRSSAKGIDLSVGERETPIGWDVIRRVDMAAFDTEDDATGRSRAIVCLTDGSQWAVADLAYSREDGQFTMTRGGRAVKIAAENVAAVEWANPHRVWLGMLRPAGYEFTPFFESFWGYRVDANVLGGPLRVAHSRFRRGLGLHSACRIAWDLGGQYDRLRARAGIDDSAGGYADADLTVYADGRELAHYGGMKRGAPPVRIDLDVKGVKRLTIEVGFGRHGDVQDRVDLVDAALIRP